MEKLLLYTSDTEKAAKIAALCRSISLPLRQLTRNELGCTVSSLAAGKAVPGKDVPPVFCMPPDLMVFSGVTNERLDRFLDTYRARSIAPIPCKAVVTPYNLGMTAWALLQQLQQEHAVTG